VNPQAFRPVLCVTLNAALDVTYTAASVTPGEVNRVDHAHAHAGGKGVNVARLLLQWGCPVTVLGLAGGRTGAAIIAALVVAELPHGMVPCAVDLRRTVTVISTADSSSTGFYEPGPTVSLQEWDAVLTAYEAELDSCRLVVLSGSLPPGVPTEAYQRLTSLARARGLPVIVDAHGKPLLHALEAGPSVVTPNEAELADSLGIDRPVSVGAAAEGARRLVAAGAERAVATLGSRGLVGVAGDQAWLASAPTVHGNPAGAGDAVVAVIADSILSGTEWPAALHRAVATAAAAVREPVAGVGRPDDVAELVEQGEVREL
jgi:tagatose 6-phosphate kinase